MVGDTTTHGQTLVIGRRATALLAMLLILVAPLIPAALAAEPLTISIAASLDPSAATVDLGALVTWVNNDSERHRIRSTAGPVGFDSGNLDPGESFSFTFNAEGTYNYVDDRDDTNSAYFGAITVAPNAEPAPGPNPPPSPPPSGGAADVDIVNRSYQPPSITVAAGSRVTWDNIDDRPHTVTDRNRSFDSGVFDTGGTWSNSFNTPGTFNYFCTLHPDMTGTVVVTGEGGDAPPPPDPTQPPAPPAPPSSAPAGDVSIVDNAFTPDTKTVTAGTTLVWSNTGALPHTVTKGGSFDSGILMPGDTYRRTFNTPGTFGYVCTLHAGMTGSVVVTGVATGEEDTDSTDSGAGSTPLVAVTQQDSGVAIFDNGYDPADVTVARGSKLVWTNTGALPHTVTARDGSFDSGFLLEAELYSLEPTAPGTYEYFCTIHPDMVATVTVVAGAGTANDDGASGISSGVEPHSADDGEGDAMQPGDDQERTVDIVDFDYDPQTMNVIGGTTVRWVNIGDLPHTVTAADDAFDSGIMATGERYERTFTEPGTYEYLCTLHPDMVGSVIVSPAAAGTIAAAGPAGAGSSSTPSLTVAVVLAAGFLAAGLAFAGGMAAFARFAAAEGDPSAGRR